MRRNCSEASIFAGAAVCGAPKPDFNWGFTSSHAEIVTPKRSFTQMFVLDVSNTGKRCLESSRSFSALFYMIYIRKFERS